MADDTFFRVAVVANKNLYLGKRQSVAGSFDTLKDKTSDYAKAHIKLIQVYNEIIEVLDKYTEANNA